MKSLNQAALVAALALPVLSGCGAGQQLVKNLDFKVGNENGSLIAGFDTKVAMGSGALPEVKLPIYNPKSPSQFLGYVETHFDGTISLRVDVTEATKIQATEGCMLPNGREIPVTLPAGVTCLSIPVINSNSQVYIAVGQQNIMAGTAITLVADTPTGNASWLDILRSLPANIFYPFAIAPDLKGSAGLFTGQKVGVGVFAVKTMGANSPVLAEVSGDFSSSVSTLGARSISSLKATTTSTKPEVFGVKTQYPVGYKMYRIQRALNKVRHTQMN